METTIAPPKTLVAKLAEAMKEIDWIKKRGRNAFHNYDYVTEADILGAIRPELAKRGIWVQTLIDSVEEKPTGRKTREGADIKQTHVKTRHVFHDGETGQTLEINGYGCGEDTGDKGVYKAITGAMKYAFSKNFLVSSGDDPENDSEDEKVDRATGEVKAQARPASMGYRNQGYGEAPPPRQDFRPAPSGDNGFPTTNENPARDYVKDIASKSGPKKDGSTYTRYSIETANNGFFTTFNPAFADVAQKAKDSGSMVMIGYRANGRFKDVESIRIVSDSLQPVSANIPEDDLPF